jgi:DNA invertase Pin-like site-specific DNA recombinase
VPNWSDARRLDATNCPALGRVCHALNRLRVDAAVGKFDRVIVWSQDRLGRADLLQMMLLREELKSLSISLIEARTGRDVNADNDSSELIFVIDSWVASKERIALLDRTRGGKQKAVSKGRFGGTIQVAGRSDHDRRHR